MATRHDFEVIKGETFDESLSFTSSGITESCSASLILRTSEHGHDYLTVDDIQVEVDTVSGVDTTTLTIQINANTLNDIVAYAYWYHLQVVCSSQKQIPYYGVFELKESTILPCDVPIEDALDDSVVIGAAPVLADLNENLQACYGRRDPLYFSVTGANAIDDIVVEVPHGGTYDVWAKVRGRWVKDPGLRHMATDYKVGIIRYGYGWKNRIPWQRYGEYVGGSLDCCEAYCDDDTPFAFTITATDIYEQSTSQSFTVAVETCSSC